MELTILHIARYAVLATLLVFSLIVLGISANLLNISSTIDGFTFTFEGLCVAVSVLTFVTIIPILAVEFLRRGAFTSLVVAELAWVFVLLVLWIAAAAETSSTPLFIGGCQLFSTAQQSNCHQFQAIQGFAWLNFVILFGWLVTLVVCAAIAHSRGNPGIWTSSVSDTQFFTKSHEGIQPATIGVASGGYPPQQSLNGYSTQSGPQQSYQGSPVSQPYQSTSPVQPSYQSTPSTQHGVAQV